MLILLFFCMQSVRDRKRRSCRLNITIQRVYLSVSIGLQVCINQYICLSKFENLGWGNKSRLHAIISGDRQFWPFLSYFGSEFVCDWESVFLGVCVLCISVSPILNMRISGDQLKSTPSQLQPKQGCCWILPLFPADKFQPRDASYFHIPKMQKCQLAGVFHCHGVTCDTSVMAEWLL